MTLPLVLVTRAADDAGRWVHTLQQAGIPAQALPLIAIRPLSHPMLRAALQRAREQLAHYHAVMCVSANAVRHFFESDSAQTQSGHASSAIKTRYWAPGPGTARALMAYGVPAAAIDGPADGAAQFDSEALWQQVAQQVTPGARVLIVRGTDVADQPGGQGRNWLAEQLRAQGAQVDFVASYERGAPVLDATQAALARSATGGGHLWLLSSGLALRHLLNGWPELHWTHAQALATHPRIAAAAQAAGFGRVSTCRPASTDVVASIKSLYEH